MIFTSEGLEFLDVWLLWDCGDGTSLPLVLCLSTERIVSIETFFKYTVPADLDAIRPGG